MRPKKNDNIDEMYYSFVFGKPKNWTVEIIEKKFTKKDIKNNHITVDRQGVKDIASSVAWDNYNDDLTFKAKNFNYNDIMEVYEFDKLIWKRTEKKLEILDKEEKEYLKSVLRPKGIRDKVKFIFKSENFARGTEYIAIIFGGDETNLYFPEFKKKFMYRGMESGKHYSLKDLGL